MKAMDFAGIPAKWWKTGAAAKKHYPASPHPPPASTSRGSAGQYHKGKPKQQFRVAALEPPGEEEEGELVSLETETDEATLAEDTFENVYKHNDDEPYF